jgi:hypothetical protein
MVISGSIRRKMRNISENFCRKIKHILYSVPTPFFFFSNRVVSEIIWKNAVDPWEHAAGSAVG